MGIFDRGLCPLCLDDLLANETELVQQTYLDIFQMWRHGFAVLMHSDCCHEDCVKQRPIIKRLEALGYFTTTDFNTEYIQVRPTGIEVEDDVVTVCADRNSHDELNCAL